MCQNRVKEHENWANLLTIHKSLWVKDEETYGRGRLMVVMSFVQGLEAHPQIIQGTAHGSEIWSETAAN